MRCVWQEMVLILQFDDSVSHVRQCSIASISIAHTFEGWMGTSAVVHAAGTHPLASCTSEAPSQIPVFPLFQHLKDSTILLTFIAPSGLTWMNLKSWIQSLFPLGNLFKRVGASVPPPRNDYCCRAGALGKSRVIAGTVGVWICALHRHGAQ